MNTYFLPPVSFHIKLSNQNLLSVIVSFDVFVYHYDQFENFDLEPL